MGNKQASLLQSFTHRGEAELGHAIHDEDTGALDQLIYSSPKLLTAKLDHGENAIHLAVHGRHHSILAHMLSYGSEAAGERSSATLRAELCKSINHRAGETGHTPLMSASEMGDVVSVRLLLDAGADPWRRDHHFNRTALHYAAAKGHVEVVQLLVEAGRRGEHHPHRSLLRELVMPPTDDEGRDIIDLCTRSGFTPLMYAAFFDHAELVAKLLELGASLNRRSWGWDDPHIRVCRDGSSALHVAAAANAPNAVHALLAGYALSHTPERVALLNSLHVPPLRVDPRLLIDSFGRTPFAVARFGRHFDVVQMLNPLTSIDSILDADAPTDRQVGVPRLVQLAAQVAQRVLSAQIQSLSDDIQTRKRNKARRKQLQQRTSKQQQAQPSSPLKKQQQQQRPEFAFALPGMIASNSNKQLTAEPGPSLAAFASGSTAAATASTRVATAVALPGSAPATSAGTTAPSPVGGARLPVAVPSSPFATVSVHAQLAPVSLGPVKHEAQTANAGDKEGHADEEHSDDSDSEDLEDAMEAIPEASPLEGTRGAALGWEGTSYDDTASPRERTSAPGGAGRPRSAKPPRSVASVSTVKKSTSAMSLRRIGGASSSSSMESVVTQFKLQQQLAAKLAKQQEQLNQSAPSVPNAPVAVPQASVLLLQNRLASQLLQQEQLLKNVIGDMLAASPPAEAASQQAHSVQSGQSGTRSGTSDSEVSEKMEDTLAACRFHRLVAGVSNKTTPPEQGVSHIVVTRDELEAPEPSQPRGSSTDRNSNSNSDKSLQRTSRVKVTGMAEHSRLLPHRSSRGLMPVSPHTAAAPVDGAAPAGSFAAAVVQAVAVAGGAAQQGAAAGQQQQQQQQQQGSSTFAPATAFDSGPSFADGVSCGGGSDGLAPPAPTSPRCLSQRSLELMPPQSDPLMLVSMMLDPGPQQSEPQPPPSGTLSPACSLTAPIPVPGGLPGGSSPPLLPGGSPPLSPAPAMSTSPALSLSGSYATTPLPAAAGLAALMRLSTAVSMDTLSVGDSDEYEQVCGICLDNGDFIAIQPCGHKICVACSNELLNLHPCQVIPCPFCRCMIRGFGQYRRTKKPVEQA